MVKNSHFQGENGSKWSKMDIFKVNLAQNGQKQEFQAKLKENSSVPLGRLTWSPPFIFWDNGGWRNSANGWKMQEDRVESVAVTVHK